uniref:Eisosome protein SEG2 n=1 Tax=Davidia involucrata TaxID=16924 RepID=A0A5B6YK39_DAVIN
MGCFLACFGSSKDRKRRRQRNKVLPREQRYGSQKPLQHTVSSEQDISEEPNNPNLELRDKSEEQLSLSTRKKVTFDSNVKTYEPVSVHESTDFLPESDKDSEKEKYEDSANSSLPHSLSDNDSVTSSVGSYPPNHRYQNCRDSDDEVEELEDEDSDLDDEELEDYDEYDEDGDNRIVGEDVWTESIPTASMESSTEISSAPEQQVRTIRSNRSARDRSVYVHPVLNPVENLSQWKAVKSKGTPPLKPDKENCIADQEIAVDTSLSNWLVSSETTPTKKTSSIGVETNNTPEISMSQGSNSVRSMDDRPILGALTVEELRQFSASSSPLPRRSPSRSPDEMPIIGTVGTYWSHSGPAKDSGSASSYKGIPNTTRKYREVFVK